MKEKRLWLIALALLAAFLCCSVCADDADTDVGVGDNPFGSFEDPSVVASGNLNDTVSWKLDQEGILTIAGAGPINSFTTNVRPAWEKYTVREVIISNGITAIGSRAFSGNTRLTSVSIGRSVKTLGSYAFLNCSGLTSVTFAGDAPTFGSNVFAGVEASVYYPETGEGWEKVICNDYSGAIQWIPVVQEGFSKHPEAQTVKQGNEAYFSAEAYGENLVYQWQYQLKENGPWFNTSSYTVGFNTPELTVLGEAKRDGFRYRCRVTDSQGKKHYSEPALLDVDVPAVSAIIGDPVSTHAMIGGSAQFRVQTQGEIIAYQWHYSTNGGNAWYRSTSATQGYHEAVLTVAGAAKRDGFLYRCTVTDSEGYKYTSNAATLDITAAQIMEDPASQTAPEGSNALFSVTAEGGVVGYKWYYSKNGTAWYASSFTGCDTATMTVPVTAARNGYFYRCAITTANGETLTSAPAQLTVE